MKHLRSLALATAATCVLALGGAATAGAATPHDPIVFVHGWSSSGTVWNTFISRFQADGWTAPELNNWSYNTRQSNVTTAGQLRDKINTPKQ